MPNVTRVIAPLALTALCTMPAAAQFEGVVTWSMGEKGQAMTQTIKGSQVRTDMSGDRGRQGAMIMDASAKTMTMLMTEQKMYMKMDLNKMAEKMDDMDHDDKTPPKLTDTGKSETIAGKTCEVYRFASEAGKPENMEMCVAKGMGYFMGGAAGPMGMGRGGRRNLAAEIAANPEYTKLYKDGFFPLRVSRLEDGKVKNEMTVTKIDAKSVDASLFTVPSDYQEMKMPAGMGPGGPPQRQ
jgi:hypothetical protein